MFWIPAILLIGFLVFFKLLAILSSKAAPQARAPGPLSGCPNTPNCISTQSTKADRRIAPLPASPDPDQAFSKLVDVLKASDRATIRQQTPDYLHAEFRSLGFGFVDDVELYLDRENTEIQMRSASRVGYSDLGTNRRRLETLRRQFLQVAGTTR